MRGLYLERETISHTEKDGTHSATTAQFLQKFKCFSPLQPQRGLWQLWGQWECQSRIEAGTRQAHNQLRKDDLPKYHTVISLPDFQTHLNFQ